MKKFTTGIDFSRLTNKDAYRNFEELIKCKICFNILVNPHDCSKCGHTFCYDCITNLKENNKPCPIGCEVYTPKPASYGITSYLSTLKFDCGNKENGCMEVLNYAQVLPHDKECKFIYSNCPNVQCNKKVKRQLLEYHIRKECEYSMFKCDRCELDLNRNEYFEHVENCKNVSCILDFKNPIINSNNSMKDILMDLPDMSDMSMLGLVKIILYQISKQNVQTDKKFETLREEVRSIKEEVHKLNNANLIFIENATNELENLSEKVSNLEIKSNPATNTSSIANLSVLKKDEHQSTNCCDSNSASSSVPTSLHSSLIGIPTKGNIKTKINSNEKTNEPHTVKKIKIEGERFKTIHQFPSTKSPPNRSPAQKEKEKVITRSPRACNHKHNYDTKDVTIREGGSFNSIKTLIKNQEMIMEQLSKVLQRIDLEENNLNREIHTTFKTIRNFNEDLVEEIKTHHSEVTISNCSKILKRIEENFKR